MNDSPCRTTGAAGRTQAGPPSIPARRILVFTHGYPPLQISGAEEHIHRKVVWWQERGYVVEVVSADPQSEATPDFTTLETRIDWVDGVKVKRLRFAVPDASRPLAETFQHPLLSPVVEQSIREFEPTLVYEVSGYVFGVLPVTHAAAAGVPVVLFATDYWHECQRVTLLRPDGACCAGPRSAADCAACRVSARQAASIFGGRFVTGLWRVAARAGASSVPLANRILMVSEFRERQRVIAHALALTDLVIVNSRFLGHRLHALGVPEERILVKRQGMSSAELASTPARCTRNDNTLRVLYLGQLSQHKGVDLLVDAVEELADERVPIHLSVHGPSTDSGYADELRRLQHPAITVGDPLTRGGIAAVLAAHDVLVVPSRWYENSPNVILEAFSAGVPVITANQGGMAEMVQHQVDGLMFQPSDMQSLAGALRRLARCPELLEQLRAGIVPPYGMDVEMEAEEQAIQAMLTRRTAESGPLRSQAAHVRERT